MDDILITASSHQLAEQVLQKIIMDLTKFDLIITPTKVQFDRLLKYLKNLFHNTYISPQKMKIQVDRLKTLNDFQKLLKNINWLCPSLKITNKTYIPCFKYCKASQILNPPRV